MVHKSEHRFVNENPAERILGIVLKMIASMQEVRADAGSILAAIAAQVAGWNETTGLPRQPITDAIFAAALARKWYEQYLGRTPDSAGLEHWTREVLTDGPYRAWANFSTSPEAMVQNVIQKATDDEAVVGSPYELAPDATSPED